MPEEEAVTIVDVPCGTEGRLSRGNQYAFATADIPASYESFFSACGLPGKGSLAQFAVNHFLFVALSIYGGSKLALSS